MAVIIGFGGLLFFWCVVCVLWDHLVRVDQPTLNQEKERPCGPFPSLSGAQGIPLGECDRVSLSPLNKTRKVSRDFPASFRWEGEFCGLKNPSLLRHVFLNQQKEDNVW